MPELGWMGDARARRAAGRVAYRLLEVTDTVGDATGVHYRRGLGGGQRRKVRIPDGDRRGHCRVAGGGAAAPCHQRSTRDIKLY